MRPEKPFFIIWNPGSPLPPTVRFQTRKSAQITADSMARRFGEQFYVCRAESYAERALAPVEHNKLSTRAARPTRTKGKR